MRSALLLLFLPLTAHAQTFDYSGTLTGTEQTLTAEGNSAPVASTAPLTGTLSGSITEAGGLEDWSFTAALNDGLSFTDSGTSSLGLTLAPFSGSTPGVVEGTDEEFTDGLAPTLSFTIDPASASVWVGDACGTNEAGVQCTIEASGTGFWTDPPSPAPEIGSDGAIAGLLLALGSAAIVGGARRRPPHPSG